jgi:hypothetical protein
MPGIGDEIDGAIQQAAHPTRHSINVHLPEILLVYPKIFLLLPFSVHLRVSA